MRRLTNRLLEAIIDMANMLEADGVDGMQGFEPASERRKAFDACMDAGDWARQQLRKRAAKRETAR